ncbi:MAG: Bifunctional ligase/repressor BirA [Desulfovibrio sp.]
MPMKEYTHAACSAAAVLVAEEVTSTFDATWRLAENAVPPAWTSLVALAQTAGRGQLRRVWHSPPGNLYVSFFLPENAALLGDMAALAVGWTVCAALARNGIETRLKWPNDILLLYENGTGKNGREGKFGGLLLEERAGTLMAGLGLNLKTAPCDTVLRAGHAVPAVALPCFDEQPHTFWAKLLPDIKDIYETEITECDAEGIRRQVESRLAWVGETVYAEDMGLSGRILGLRSDGALRLECRGKAVFVTSGSVTPERARLS